MLPCARRVRRVCRGTGTAGSADSKANRRINSEEMVQPDAVLANWIRRLQAAVRWRWRRDCW